VTGTDATVAFSRLLRAPGEVAASCREGRDLRAIVGTSLASIVVGAGAFGAVVGSYRGGWQIVYAGVKIPMALVATLAICAPAFHAVVAGLGRPWPFRSIVALAVAATGRSSLCLLAFTPALWLAMSFRLGYHASSLAAALAYAVAGIAALSVLVRGLADADAHRGVRHATTATFVMLFLAVGGQMAWILRPYLVRPRTETIPFVRAREGALPDALVTSGLSSMGIYRSDRWY
jgi:hypothetical protein